MGSYLRNCWYMAAWSSEIAPGAAVSRTLLEEPIALFRGNDGETFALADRCPHRFAPLSLGPVVTNGVECPYHGLGFDRRGQCFSNPHGPVTARMRVQAYPVVERHRAIWIWMGDPDAADPAAIRDLGFLADAPDTAFSSGYVHGEGSYQLFVDNILDLSHADYLHPDTLGGGSFTRTKAKVGEQGGAISLLWDCRDETPSPTTATLFPGIATVDSWTEVVWTAPGIMTLRSGSVPAGMSRDGADEMTNVHILTPETATTCHYFYGSTRNFATEDAALNDRIAHLRARIFSSEDEPMIRAIQTRMGEADFWSLKPLLISIDEGAVRVRRKLDAMIVAERTAHAGMLRA